MSELNFFGNTPAEYWNDADEWMPDAKCYLDDNLRHWQVDYREDQFFSFKSGEIGKKKRAQEYCSTCPVKYACLNHALKWDEPGFWGGTTETERKAMKRRARKSAQEWIMRTLGQSLDGNDPIAS